jgi:predicted double-glycine peptidase
MNTWSYADIAKEDNKDITNEAEALKRLQENYNINKNFESYLGLGNIDSIMKNETNNETKESARGKELDIPTDRQFSYWDCGDAVVVSALARFGIEPNPESLIKDLGSTEDWGTEPESINSVLESYGLTVELKEMTIEDVKQYIDNNIPVILDIQAWHFEDGGEYDYTNEWQDGHYVTAYGYTEEVIKFKDPSSLINRDMTWEGLESRWHDIDKQGNKLYNIGIACYGLPVTYNSNKTEPLG